MQRKNVFFIGLNGFNRAKLEAIRNADRYRFHGILDPAEVLETYDFPIPDMLGRSEAQLRQWQRKSGLSIDAIAGYMDFPVSTMLGFRIRTRDEFDHAMVQIREQIHLISGPFNFVLEQADLPAEVAKVEGHYCLAESLIGGWQCTVEGYAFEGDVQAFGIVDSVRYENGSSFFRYEYPSTLPDRVREEMIEVTKRVIRHLGFDNSAFNIEFYWEREHNTIWLLEVNTRVSQSHSDVFEKVDGSSNQQVTVQVACGEKPDFPFREGQFKCAAKFFWRVFDGDAEVTRVPSPEDIAKVVERFPTTVVNPQVKVGMKLSDLLEQDSYSYAICQIYIGGDDQKDLLNKYLDCQDMLPFEFKPLP